MNIAAKKNRMIRGLLLEHRHQANPTAWDIATDGKHEHKTSTKHEGARECCSLTPCLSWLRGPATQNARRPRRCTGLTCVKPRSSEEPVRHPNGFDGFDPVGFAESCGIPPPRQGYHLAHP